MVVAAGVVAVARAGCIAAALAVVAVAVVDAVVVAAAASFVGSVVVDSVVEIDSPSLDYSGCFGLD